MKVTVKLEDTDLGAVIDALHRRLLDVRKRQDPYWVAERVCLERALSILLEAHK